MSLKVSVQSLWRSVESQRPCRPPRSPLAWL